MNPGTRDLSDLRIWFVVLGSVLVSAAGYLFNDFVDRKSDTINKPDKLYIQYWNPIGIWTVFVLFNVLALLLFYLVDTRLMVWFAGVVFIMIIYSLVLKKLPMIGNIAVSFLAAFSVYVVYLTFGIQEKYLVIFFAGFAALLTYVRELVKDMEDVEGDREAGYQTFPVLLGLGQAKSLVSLSTVFIMVMYLYLLWNGILFNFFQMPLLGVFALYHLLCVLAPMVLLLVWNSNARDKSDFSRLSNLAKYIMATGMLSMMFF